MSPADRCDCGHLVSEHKNTGVPGAPRGRCLYCRCQGVTQRVKWEPDEPEEGGDE